MFNENPDENSSPIFELIKPKEKKQKKRRNLPLQITIQAILKIIIPMKKILQVKN